MNKCDFEETKEAIIQKFLTEYKKTEPVYYYGKLVWSRFEINIYDILYITSPFTKECVGKDARVKEVADYWRKAIQARREEAACQRMLKLLNHKP